MNPIDLTTVSRVESWLAPLTLNAKELSVMGAVITGASAYWLWATGAVPDGFWPDKSPLVEPVDFDEMYDGNGNDRLYLMNRPIQSVQALTVNGIAIAASASNSPGYVIDQSKKCLVMRSNVVSYGSQYSGLRGRSCGNKFWAGTQNVRVQYTGGFNQRAITDELQTVRGGAGPYTAQVSQLWLSDAGVEYFDSGIALTKVATSPLVGQYYLQGGGSYLVNIADANRQLQISYKTSGTPADILVAATQMVALNYKRRQNINESSQAMSNGAGTVSYQTWEFPPEVQSVIRNYTRQALVG